MPNIDSIHPKNNPSLGHSPQNYGQSQTPPEIPNARVNPVRGNNEEINQSSTPKDFFSSSPSLGTARSNRVNLFMPNPAPKKSKLRIFLKYATILIVVAVIGLGTVVFARAVNLSNKIFVGQKTSFFQKIKDVLRGGGGDVRLIGEQLGQINILLLGIGGEGHDGPYLTDTMILAQIRPEKNQITLTSIPRDFWVEMPGSSGYAKINAAFSNGYVKNRDYNEAGKYAREVVEKISGLQIPYFAVVDFKGFEQAVDRVGGLDVNVERTFTDSTFPNDKEGYLPPVTFEKGPEHMDGARSLQFARSRHAEGPEGSDFARSLRQQKIIKAFKEKIISLNLITDAGKINSLAGIFADHFHTNISPGELFRVYALSRDKNILSLSLDPETKLLCPKIMEDSGAYVLTPCEGKNQGDIQNYFKNSFATGQIYEEKSVIWIAQSGTDKKAYEDAKKKLTDSNLTVFDLPYGGSAMPYNIFYQANPKPATAEFIKNTLNAKEVTLPPPGININKDKVDIIVILGESQN
jgi:polyisoprenyl-teichoic acid--peptidoglycan teichoic acid transferase